MIETKEKELVRMKSGEAEGVIYEEDGILKFLGDADESAKMFFDLVIGKFNEFAREISDSINNYAGEVEEGNVIQEHEAGECGDGGNGDV